MYWSGNLPFWPDLALKSQIRGFGLPTKGLLPVLLVTSHEGVADR